MKGMQFDSRQMQGAATFLEYAVPISVGTKEVIKVHAIYAQMQMGSVDQNLRAYFSAKSVKIDGGLPPEDENELMEDKHTFWRTAFNAARLTSGVFYYTYDQAMYFDPAIILIRQPRICFVGGSTSNYLNVFWYYTKEQPSGKEMTTLMVKKHA